ncbi:MAG: AAA family ATPase [Anaerolineales bacterium]
MSRITLSLLGTPRLERDGELIAVDRHKAFALLAYLAVTSERHRRDTLAALFWPDYDQARARAAVRRALASLTKALPGEWWDTDRETIGLNYRTRLSGDDLDFWLDVDQFHARLAECRVHGHPATEVCSTCFAPLAEAAALYRGDFLSGFTLRDSPDFDDWQFSQTESLRREMAGTLERLGRVHAAQGASDASNFEAAIGYARRWLALDPLHEPAHRMLIQLYAQSGQRYAALRQYNECVRALERELGVSPQGATTQLYEVIKADQWPTSAPDWPPVQPTEGALEHYATAPPAPRPGGDGPQREGEAARVIATFEGSLSPFERLVRGRFVGRERELAQVEAIWQRVNAGEARVLLVSGELGIGKTRLAREIAALAKASGARVLAGECYAEGGAPYAPIAQIIRGAFTRRETASLPDFVLADLITLTPDLASRYPHLPANPPLDPQSEQRRLFENVTALIDLLAQATQAPLLLFVEDGHWADSGTLFLLRHLAHRACQLNLKLLILMTYRDAEAHLDEARALRDVLLDLDRERLSEPLRLSRLSREHTRDLLAVMLGAEGGVSVDFLDSVYGETEGNPFFIEEVCKTLIEEGKLYYAGGHWRRVSMESITLPPSVRGAILSRVEKLPELVQEVLRVAAILGREFDLEALQEASEADEAALRAALERAERAQLISQIERAGRLAFIFAHALIPFALRESIGGLRRQRLHARVAKVIEGQRPEEIEALAYHFVAAGEYAKAVEYSRRAAKRAERMYAYDLAIRHLLAALELLEAREGLDTRLMLLEGLADLHSQLNEGARAIPIYLEALQVWRGLPGADKWIAVRLQRKIGETATSMNRFADYQRFAATARASLHTGLALTQDEPPHLETARLLWTLSRDAWYVIASADWEAAERYALAAVTMAEQLDAPEELSPALEALAAVYGARGLFRERVQVCLRRLALSQGPRFGDLRERANILLQTGNALLSVGGYAEALRYGLEAESLSGQIQDITRQANALTLQGQCLFAIDRWDDLLGIEEKLRDIQTRYAFERTGVAVCFYIALNAAVKALRGDHDRANVLREDAYGIMVAIGGPPERWVRNQHL